MSDPNGAVRGSLVSRAGIFDTVMFQAEDVLMASERLMQLHHDWSHTGPQRTQYGEVLEPSDERPSSRRAGT